MKRMNTILSLWSIIIFKDVQILVTIEGFNPTPNFMLVLRSNFAKQYDVKLVMSQPRWLSGLMRIVVSTRCDCSSIIVS